MRVLHTADWHLGQRFQQGRHERLDEHRCFLDWLIATIEREQVEVLVVAGDVFDSGNPSAAARQLYYSLLAQLRRSATCRDVVVVGGNHDSADTLNASATLLKELRVHVVGGLPARVETQCLPLPHGAATPRLVVAAVPYLREADVRTFVPGETAEARQARQRDGIAAHYHAVAACVAQYRNQGVPVLATGHLFAAGGEAGDAELPIHVGTLGQITAAAFPAAFDYVALGHLHRPQVVGGRAHIRYSGAPVPLSFSETAHRQQVLLLDFAGPYPPEVRALDVPCTRRLVRLRGPLDEVLARIAEFDNADHPHEAWAEVVVATGQPWAYVQDQVREAWQSTEGRLRVVSGPLRLREAEPLPAFDAAGPAPAGPQLRELTPRHVFERLLDQQQYEPDARQQLLATFDELLAGAVT